MKSGNERFDSIAYIRHILEDDHSGIDLPAAIFVETTQAEGGVNVASVEWLMELRAICNEYDILLTSSMRHPVSFEVKGG